MPLAIVPGLIPFGGRIIALHTPGDNNRRRSFMFGFESNAAPSIGVQSAAPSLRRRVATATQEF